MHEIHQGVVFFIQHREVSSNSPHYLVVLNPQPLSSEIIVLGVVTSGIEKAEKRITIIGEDSSTLVKVTPKDYPELKHDSVIDCNTPVKYFKWEFEQCFGQLNSKRRSDMPDYICNAVVNGIITSKQVPPKIKKALDRLT